jgi:hypothetical protein
MTDTATGPVKLAPAEKLLEIARWSITRDDNWDMFPEFLTLHWDEENDRVRPGTIALIDAGFPPEAYPKVMAAMALNAIGDSPEDVATAYMLVVEGYGVAEPEKGATEAEKAQFEHDRKNRGFHAREDAREVKMALVSDITGQSWMVTRYRDTGEVTDSTEDEGLKSLGGRMPDGVRRVALATGTMLREMGCWDGSGTW